MDGVDPRRRTVPTVQVLSMCAALIAIDLSTKSWASRSARTPLVDSVANDRLMLGIGDLPTPWMIVLSTLIVAAATAGAAALVRAGHLAWWVLPLGVAGFVGNVIDRLALGHVRDWLVVGPTRWNLADLLLLVAIPLVVAAGITSVRSGQPDPGAEYREEVKQR